MKQMDEDFEITEEEQHTHLLTEPLILVELGPKQYIGHLYVDEENREWLYSPYLLIENEYGPSDLLAQSSFVLDKGQDLIIVGSSDELRLQNGREFLSVCYINGIPILIQSLRH